MGMDGIRRYTQGYWQGWCSLIPYFFGCFEQGFLMYILPDTGNDAPIDWICIFQDYTNAVGKV